MIIFDESIVKILNNCFLENKEYVESVLLSSYGFNIKFVNFDIHCYEKVYGSLSGNVYEWDDAPNSAPWGLFGRQLAKSAKLKKPTLLSITFESGDYIDIETIESKYESIIFKFLSTDGFLEVEIF